MSTKLNITPGEVKQADSGLWVNDDSGFCIADFGWDEPMSDKQRNHAVANATLYADAHNTYNKCQMLPSELLDRAKWNKGTTYQTKSDDDVFVSKKAWADAARSKYGNRCSRCGWDKARCDVHHIVPRSKGGLNKLSNAEVICPNCHRLHHEVR